MKLTRTHEARLLAGDYKPLVYDTKPDFEAGAGAVFAWSRPKRHCDPETGQVFEAPAAPVAWIKVTKIVRQTRCWVVHFDVFDNRHRSLMLAYGSGYTTNPKSALDRFEAVLSDDDQRRISTDSRAQRAAQAERSDEARRRQERSIRGRLRETLRGLSPAGQVVLLAEIERALEAAGATEEEAA